MNEPLQPATAPFNNHAAPLRVRQRAAALIEHGGHVLLHRVVGDEFWALPGGGIEPGESAAQALVREMQEELGQPIEPGALACVVENFFTYAGMAHHEIGLYLRARLPAASPLLSTPGPYAGTEGTRALEFAWFSASDLQGLDVRPALLAGFLPQWLGPEPMQVAHIVHRDD